MAESSGLDRRIDNLTVEREVGFYSWDLDCLESVIDIFCTTAFFNIDQHL